MTLNNSNYIPSITQSQATLNFAQEKEHLEFCVRTIKFHNEIISTILNKTNSMINTENPRWSYIFCMVNIRIVSEKEVTLTA